MGVNNVGQDRVGVEVEVREEERLRIPSWFGEAVLWGQYWLESGLVGYLEEEVRVARGRMGQYEVADFVLLLNSYAVSGDVAYGNKCRHPAIAVMREKRPRGLWDKGYNDVV